MKTTLLLVLALFGYGLADTAKESVAQEINSPTHIPNRAANKLTHARIKALIASSIAEDGVDDELGRREIRDFNRDGCNISIGNAKIVTSGGRVDRDVIIDGDVINACR